MALSAELQIGPSEDLLAYCKEFGFGGKSLALSVPMVYPFEALLEPEALEDHILTALEPIKRFKVLLRGITGYPGGFVLLNFKAGNDRVILMHDLLHTGPLASAKNPLYTFFPHVLLFRCPTVEATTAAVMRGQKIQRGYEGEVTAVRIDGVNSDGTATMISAIDLEAA